MDDIGEMMCHFYRGLWLIELEVVRWCVVGCCGRCHFGQLIVCWDVSAWLCTVVDCLRTLTRQKPKGTGADTKML